MSQGDHSIARSCSPPFALKRNIIFLPYLQTPFSIPSRRFLLTRMDADAKC